MATISRLTTSVTTAVHGGLSHLQRAPLPLLSLAITRSYRIAAAAQPQFDYDRYYYNYYDYDHGGGDGRIPPPAVDAEGSRPLRGVQWVFIGNPNGNRHVYAAMISKLLEVPHISITTLLRQDLSPRSPIYKQIAEAVNRGKLVPESIIFGLLSKRLEDGHDRGESGFILDGIPRTSLQAEILDQLVDIDLVVNFKCSEDYFQASRSSSDETKTTFPGPDEATEDAGPKVSTFYTEQLKTLKDYYHNQKKLIDFQVGNAPGETWKGLIAALHLQHLNAVNSSRSLPMEFRVP